MKSSDFVEFAGRIAASARPNDLACLRSAISRAYYGVFHLGTEFLSDLGMAPSATGSHDAVPQFLQNSGNSFAVDAGYLLSDLHSDRVKADYRLTNTEVEKTAFARLCVERAMTIERLLQDARIASADPASLQKIKESISEYRRRTGR